MLSSSFYGDEEDFPSLMPRALRRAAKHSGKKLGTGRLRDWETEEVPNTTTVSHAEEEAFEAFSLDRIITGPGPILKQGKEACVYFCMDESGKPVAVKVYKDIEHRSFQAMAGYLQGRFAEAGINRRDAMHILSTPRALQAFWVHAEYAVLYRLHRSGVPVPRPLAECATGLAMEFIHADGCPREAAPRLKEFHTDTAGAQRIKGRLFEAIEGMLELDLVHGDLSPYNILVHAGEPVIIDFPQAVDARFNTGGRDLLRRDILNICRYAPDPVVEPEDEADLLCERLWYSRRR